MKALKEKKYIVSSFDPKFKKLNLISKKKIDVIFNALHGKDGEDGKAQIYFEYLKIPYTHSGVISSYNAMNKIISKIPLIGNIVIPKEIGEGLFGVSFKMKGPKGNIKTSINPIRTLTPRFIQKIIDRKKETN